MPDHCNGDSGGSRIYKRGPRTSAVCARIEAPQAPTRVGSGRGVSLPTGEGSGKGAMPPPQNFFFDFGSQDGDFRCIMGTIFTVQLFGLNAKASSRG